MKELREVLSLFWALAMYNCASSLWTAGRVVEGARLERGYRATYLGFESLAVHHLLLFIIQHTENPASSKFNSLIIMINNKSIKVTFLRQ